MCVHAGYCYLCLQEMQALQKSDYFCVDALYLHEPASDDNRCKVSYAFCFFLLTRLPLKALTMARILAIVIAFKVRF